MIIYSKKIFFLTCFVGLALAEDQSQTPSAITPDAAKKKWWSIYIPFRLDSTQNKEDLKEVIEFGADKAKKLLQSSPALLLNEIDKPENKEKIKGIGGKIVPKVFLDYITGSEDNKKQILDNIMVETNKLINNVGQAAEKYKVSENIRARFYPSTLDLAYYGFVFGSAVFIGFNGFYYLQQQFRDYLAIRKPKYISPLSKIGLFDQYKQKAKTFFYGPKKRADDVQSESIASELTKHCITTLSNKKQYASCLIRFSTSTFVKDQPMRLLSNVANNLEMDFIAVSSINLLQKNTVIDIWNELAHIIHKNNRPVLLYIDNISLASMDGTEYSEREEAIRMLSLAIQSSADVLRSKCMMVGLLEEKELFEGPFVEIYTKQVYL